MAKEHHSHVTIIHLDRPPSPQTIDYPADALQKISKPNISVNTNIVYPSSSPTLPPNPPPTPETPTDVTVLSSAASRDSTSSQAELPPSPPPSPPLTPVPNRQQNNLLEFSRRIMESKKFSSSIHGKLCRRVRIDILNDNFFHRDYDQASQRSPAQSRLMMRISPHLNFINLLFPNVPFRIISLEIEFSSGQAALL